MELLTDSEKQHLVVALLRGSKNALDQEQIEKVYAWARDIRLKQGILENVFIGNAFLSIQDGNVLVSLTTEGEAEAGKVR